MEALPLRSERARDQVLRDREIEHQRLHRTIASVPSRSPEAPLRFVLFFAGAAVVFAAATGTWLWDRSDTSRLEGVPDETRALARSGAPATYRSLPGFRTLPMDAQMVFVDACARSQAPACLDAAANELEGVIEERHRRRVLGSAAYGVAGAGGFALLVRSRRRRSRRR